MPTELEWQYAAGGGTELRQYPWVGAVVDIEHALYGYCGNGVSSDCTVASIAEVGSKPAGAGKWGQLDLAGSMWEWALDVQGSPFPLEDPCDNCAALAGLSPRMIRGGSWYEGASALTVDNRGANDSPDSSWHNVGIRCARTP
jgi:formylglycine-generating enzyme required for sulfatase activity